MTLFRYRSATRIKSVLAVLAAATIFAVQIPQASSPGAATLDDSWGQVLSWGILHHAQWGTQLAFTYGPIGFLRSNAQFNPHLYWAWVPLQLCMAVGYALLLSAGLRRCTFPAALGMALGVFVFAAGWVTSACWILVYPLSAMQLELWSREPGSRLRDAGILVLAAFATIPSLLKFSVFPLWLLSIPTGMGILWLRRRRKLALAFFLMVVIAEIATWLACGQGLTHLPAFWRTSWQLATDYGTAMQGPGIIDADDWLALVGLLFTLALTAFAAWPRRRSPAYLITAIFLAISVLLAYKASVTRADLGHLLIFWTVCVFITPLAASLLHEAAPDSHGRSLWVFGFAVLPLAILWLGGTYAAASGDTQGRYYTGVAAWQGIRQGYNTLTHLPQDYRAHLQDWDERRARLTLPWIRSMVGHQPVDIMMNDQALLLANDLDYRPRPVFQSYSAYSDHLSRMNEDYFLDPTRAPKWVILTIETVDDRYPGSDDARALPRVLQIYDPWLREGDQLLMRRLETTAPLALDGLQRAVLAPRFDADTILPRELGTAPVFAKLRINLSWAAKLRMLLFRAPNFYVEVETADHIRRRYQLVRAVAASGFLLTPLLRNNDDYIAWLSDPHLNKVMSIRLLQSYWMGLPMFRSKAVLRLYSTKLNRTLTQQDIRTTYPGFSHIPDRSSKQPKMWRVSDEDPLVAFLSAPATLTFTLPPGNYHVAARYGIMPNALTDATCINAHADGIGLGTGLEGQGIPESDIEYFNPYKNPSHAYARNFSREIKVPANKRVIITLNHGPPGSNGACDWSWIRDLVFKKL